MKKLIRVICLLATAAVLFTCMTCCSSNGKDSAGELTLHMKMLDPGKIDFCFWGYSSDGQPYNLNGINEMLAELNKKTMHDINTEIKFQWMPSENYESELMKLLKAGNGPDAFITYSAENYCNEGVAKDITDLLPRYAPHYFSLLGESWGDEIETSKVDNKFYTILNNGLYPPQSFVMARQSLVEKYAPNGIKTFEDYGEFMQNVKDKENDKDTVPGLVRAYDYLNAYMKGNGFFYSCSTGIYCRWDAKNMISIRAEDTSEFKTACDLYKQWQKNGLLINTANPSYGTIINNGHMASMLIDGMQVHNAFNQFPTCLQYKLYPLYPDSSYIENRLTNSIAINANSANCERVLRFIEWLQSSQENYDLFMYGVKDKNYKLKDNALDTTDIDSRNVISDWWGSEAFRNYIYDRPYTFEPEKYKEFLEKCCNNNNIMTIAQIYGKFGYDVGKFNDMTKDEKGKLKDKFKDDEDKLMSYSDKRVGIYNEFVKQLEAGSSTKTLAEMMEEQGGKEATDKLLDINVKLLDEYKK